jgi:hypothetical protein
MKSLDFCYWLQGFFEISKDSELKNIDENQVKTIQKHLCLVFGKETTLPNNNVAKPYNENGTCGISQPIQNKISTY